jgi:hypothetical protein
VHPAIHSRCSSTTTLSTVVGLHALSVDVNGVWRGVVVVVVPGRAESGKSVAFAIRGWFRLLHDERGLSESALSLEGTHIRLGESRSRENKTYRLFMVFGERDRLLLQPDRIVFS